MKISGRVTEPGRYTVSTVILLKTREGGDTKTYSLKRCNFHIQFDPREAKSRSKVDYNATSLRRRNIKREWSRPITEGESRWSSSEPGNTIRLQCYVSVTA